MEQKIKIHFDDLIKINDYLFEIPSSFRSDMRVPARVYITKEMFADIRDDRSLWQLVNVTTLPGIQKWALAMPDIHQGYGFPIGGVAATLIAEDGVISPGGIGYDINCGVRLLVADLSAEDLRPHLDRVATDLCRTVPSGVGRGGKLKLDSREIDKVLKYGARYMVELGYGTEADLEFCEENGCMPGADVNCVSSKAKKRGGDQLGTLGSGNHFLEVQEVDEIFDEKAAQIYGLVKGGVAIMIHCGSRGLGHQICTDYVRSMMEMLPQFGYQLPDRELVCAPVKSDVGRDYFAAMVAGANFAWANRHTIASWVRDVWQREFGIAAQLTTVYDVSHNIGKREWHDVAGKKVELMVHRKGATRAFGPHHAAVPLKYKEVGQPVFIPGTMGTSSYVLAGTSGGMEQAFGTSCHGAGRRLSRSKAKKIVSGSELRKELEARGIIIRCDSSAGLAEEAPIAYKDVELVVEVVARAGLAKKIARVKPMAVIKGG